MKLIRVKLAVAAMLTLAVLLFAGANFRTTAGVTAGTVDDDAATLYKKLTCFGCHKADATKFFDPEKSDEELVHAIVNGVKGEKPPYMPAYEAKGVDAEKAAALVAHMRELREAAGE